MNSRFVAQGFLSAALLFVSPLELRSENVRFYNLEGFGEFLDGDPESTSVTEEGSISLPPLSRERYSDSSASFSAVTTRGDNILVAQLDSGEVLEIDRAGQSRVLYHAKDKLITALLVFRDTLLIAIASPAQILKIDKNGKAKKFYTPDSEYVWDMIDGPDGSLFISTGEPGQVIQVDTRGNGTVLFSPEQKHLRALTYDRKQGIFVGGAEKGILYHAKHDYKFKALHDTRHSEITGIIVYNQYIYVAGVSGSERTLSEEKTKSTEEKSKLGLHMGSSGIQLNTPYPTRI